MDVFHPVSLVCYRNILPVEMIQWIFRMRVRDVHSHNCATEENLLYTIKNYHAFTVWKSYQCCIVQLCDDFLWWLFEIENSHNTIFCIQFRITLKPMGSMYQRQRKSLSIQLNSRSVRRTQLYMEFCTETFLALFEHYIAVLYYLSRHHHTFRYLSLRLWI